MGSIGVGNCMHNLLLVLGGVHKYFVCSSLFGEDSNFDEYFSDGLKSPTRLVLKQPSTMSSSVFQPLLQIGHGTLRYSKNPP